MTAFKAADKAYSTLAPDHSRVVEPAGAASSYSVERCMAAFCTFWKKFCEYLNA